jgi:hypothetical protein
MASSSLVGATPGSTAFAESARVQGLCIMLIDVLVALYTDSQVFRFSRPIRPFFLILR